MRASFSQALIIGAAAFVLSASVTCDLYAADPAKVGVVDPQAVLEKSKAGRRALDALKEYAQARQKLLANDEEELKNLEKQLKDQESGMSETLKREKTGQFRNKLQDFQKRAQEFNQELGVKQKELVDEYMKKIANATRTVAEKGGYTVVVDRGSDNTIKIVIYARDTLDLTDQVIREFDRQNR
jgi:outer membrane protein